MDWQLSRFSLQFLWNFQHYFGYFKCLLDTLCSPPATYISRSPPSYFYRENRNQRVDCLQLSAARPLLLSLLQIKAPFLSSDSVKMTTLNLTFKYNLPPVFQVLLLYFPHGSYFINYLSLDVSPTFPPLFFFPFGTQTYSSLINFKVNT